jgi:hypothetical protein
LASLLHQFDEADAARQYEAKATRLQQALSENDTENSPLASIES